MYAYIYPIWDNFRLFKTFYRNYNFNGTNILNIQIGIYMAVGTGGGGNCPPPPPNILPTQKIQDCKNNDI